MSENVIIMIIVLNVIYNVDKMYSADKKKYLWKWIKWIKITSLQIYKRNDFVYKLSISKT